MQLKLFVDSNVVLDALLNRAHNCKDAKLLLALGLLGEFEIWVSPSQWTDLFYILSEGGKSTKINHALMILKELRSCVHICMLGEQEIDSAMKLDWNDLEDAIVYEAARTIKPKALISQNISDFKDSKIPVFTCREFFQWLKNQHDIVYQEVDLENSCYE